MVGWCVAGAVLVALLLFMARHTKQVSVETRRLAAQGTRMGCTVVGKRMSGGKSKSYYLELSLDGPPRWSRVERSVPRGVWDSVGPGSRSIWYHDPGRLLEGVSELERPSKESLGGLYVGLVLAGVTVAAVVWALLFLRRRMQLLTSGVELRVAGDGRLARDGRSVKVRLPSPVANYARLRSGDFVALADPDLSRSFFPELRDVPLDALLEGLPIAQLQLPKEPREPHPGWERWIRRRYSGFGWGLAITSLFGLCGLGVLLFSGKTTGAAAISAVAGVLAGVLLVTWRQGLQRHRRLWREGAEVHAALLRTTVIKASVDYGLAYVDREEAVHVHVALPNGVTPWKVPAGEGGRVPLHRVVVLVDPKRPRRFAVVPFEIGR